MNRLHYIDIAKGILILCLLVSHFGIALEKNNVGTQFFAPILYFVPMFSVFFMQCFFIITGYCSNLNISGKSYFEKLSRQLIVPYVFLGFLNGLTSHVLMPDGFHGFFTCFWFLNALVISKTIVWGLKRTISKDGYVLLVSLFLLILGVVLNEYDIGHDYFDFRKGLIATFFVALGQMLRNSSAFSDFLRKGWLIYPLVMLACYAFHYQWNLPLQDASIKVSLLQIPLFLALTVLGSVTTLTFVRKAKYLPAIEFFGRNSIIVYCLHFPYLCMIAKQLLGRITPSNYFMGGVIFCLTFILELIILTIIINLLNIYPLSILVGKYKKN